MVYYFVYTNYIFKNNVLPLQSADVSIESR